MIFTIKNVALCFERIVLSGATRTWTVRAT